MDKIYFHVDVNSAFLSWSALKLLREGQALDLRTVPSAVGGDEEKRHGVVLAKSGPAKAFGIHTGESLFSARLKCPQLVVTPPDFDWYVQNSKALIAILNDYSPDVEQYSIDEAFLDMTGTGALFGPPLEAARTIRERVRRELGFTVNIGVAPNRLLAKMASDFEKPDKVHTLYPAEVPAKMWPLPVGALFGVGPSAVKKLNRCGVLTIGDLAQSERRAIVDLFGVRGDTLWNYANGREADPVTKQHTRDNTYGNSVTLPRDLTRPEQADATMLALCGRPHGAGGDGAAGGQRLPPQQPPAHPARPHQLHRPSLPGGAGTAGADVAPAPGAAGGGQRRKDRHRPVRAAGPVHRQHPPPEAGKTGPHGGRAAPQVRRRGRDPRHAAHPRQPQTVGPLRRQAARQGEGVGGLS